MLDFVSKAGVMQLLCDCFVVIQPVKSRKYLSLGAA
jgi:hypothetical protein